MPPLFVSPEVWPFVEVLLFIALSLFQILTFLSYSTAFHSLHLSLSMVEPEATPPVAAAALEAEFDDWESDSAVGQSITSSTTSISSSILKYREENGRTYHAYKVANCHRSVMTKANKERTETITSLMMSGKMTDWTCNITFST